jgi:hypothetical protein
VICNTICSPKLPNNNGLVELETCWILDHTWVWWHVYVYGPLNNLWPWFAQYITRTCFIFWHKITKDYFKNKVFFRSYCMFAHLGTFFNTSQQLMNVKLQCIKCFNLNSFIFQ